MGLAVGAFMASFLVASAAEVTFVTATTATTFLPGTELHLKVVRGSTLPATGTVTVALSSSNGGQFGNANLTTCTDDGSFALFGVTISSSASQRAFCYRNATEGADTITATFTIASTTEVATLSFFIANPPVEEDDDENGTSTDPSGSGTTTDPGANGTTTEPSDGDGGEGTDENGSTATPSTTTLTITITGDGTGTVRTDHGEFTCRTNDEVCVWPFMVGATVTLQAVPDEDSSFDDSWTVGSGTCIGNRSPCTVNVTPGLSLTAHFDDDDGGSNSGTRVGARSSQRSGGGSSDDDDNPTPQVAGEQVSVVPTGAPQTGAGVIVFPTPTPVIIPARLRLLAER
jgi:hypothetical protein